MNTLNWGLQRQHVVLTLCEEFPEVEVLFEQPQRTEKIAILCHPHPLYQGNMHSKVLVRLARACHANQIATLRFHFPGVGKTLGVFGGGVTELKLAQTLFDYISSTAPYQLVGVGGFSFGGGIALRLARTVDWAVVLAPSLRGFEADLETESLLIVHAQDDEIVPFSESFSHMTSLSVFSKKLFLYQKSGHFFMENLDRLQADLQKWLYAQYT